MLVSKRTGGRSLANVTVINLRSWRRVPCPYRGMRPKCQPSLALFGKGIGIQTLRPWQKPLLSSDKKHFLPQRHPSAFLNDRPCVSSQRQGNIETAGHLRSPGAQSGGPGTRRRLPLNAPQLPILPKSTPCAQMRYQAIPTLTTITAHPRSPPLATVARSAQNAPTQNAYTMSIGRDLVSGLSLIDHCAGNGGAS